MRKSADLRSLAAREMGWLVGGCHGTCIFLTSDDRTGARIQRQIVFANCIVLMLCAAIAAFVVVLA
jgi:hypothetical protein